MLQKLYSTLLRKYKERSDQKRQKMTALQRHWLDVTLGRTKSFLPLPPEAALEIATPGTIGLPEALDGIRKRLSILEEKTLGKSCPLNSEHQSMGTPNVEVRG